MDQNQNMNKQGGGFGPVYPREFSGELKLSNGQVLQTKVMAVDIAQALHLLSAAIIHQIKLKVESVTVVEKSQIVTPGQEAG